jgi:ABC-2 type transport system ATP-binding protein
MKARLEMAGVIKAYDHRRVLDRAWLQVKAGEAVGLLGANGAGKTTMLRIGAGLVIPDAGLVRILKQHGRANVRYFGGERTLPQWVSKQRWGRWFGLEKEERDRRPMGLLSRGSRQLFGLQTTLAPGNADVILLDEPWEGLDPNGAAWLTDCVARWQARGTALLISSHRLHDLSSACTRFVLLEHGRCHDMDMDSSADRVAQLEQVFSRR